VRDKHKLGLKQWFESKNPHALAQSIERMLEASRQGYWKADPATVKELKERYRDLANKYNVHTDNAAFEAFVGAGFGVAGASKPASARSVQTEVLPPRPVAPAPPLQGLLLEKVATPPPPTSWLGALGGVLLLLTTIGGGLSAFRREGQA
jgi:cobaltochelatase CobN